MRIIGKDNFDSTYRFRNDEFKIRDIVLIFDFTTIINISTFKKINYRQIRSYRITESDPFKGIYRISELDNTIFRNIYVNNRLKRFYVAIIFDVFSRYRTSAFSDNKNDIVNFADAF